MIRLAALLHDLGKIGIPDAILHKPGPLTAEEWVIMRGHPAIGQQILAQVGGVFALLSRIVVDSYDAMLSKRPYRKPRSLAQARVELQRCSGSQFDPMVVEAFLQVLDEQEASREESRAPSSIPSLSLQ